VKLKSIFITVFLAVAAVGALSAQSLKSKPLVIYFSHTGENYGVGVITEGNTAIIAEMIAEKTGSDTFEIVPVKDYPNKYKECTDVAMAEQKKNARPEFKGDIDTSGYDTVFVGWPVWWGDLPMVVYTFLEKHDLNDKTVIPFTTHEGSGLANAERAMKKLYPKASVKEGLAVRGKTAQNDRGTANKAVDAWLKKLGM
jgi:flavodoxin